MIAARGADEWTALRNKMSYDVVNVDAIGLFGIVSSIFVIILFISLKHVKSKSILHPITTLQ